jgi:hypothetical protein
VRAKAAVLLHAARAQSKHERRAGLPLMASPWPAMGSERVSARTRASVTQPRATPWLEHHPRVCRGESAVQPERPARGWQKGQVRLCLHSEMNLEGCAL